MKKIYLLFLLVFALIETQAQNNCATAVPITIPFTSGTLTTCGTGDDYVAGSYFDEDYGDGEDYVFSFTVTNAPVTYQVALGGSATWKIASIHSACAPTSTNAIGGLITNGGSSATGSFTFSTNGTYYIFVDTWPTPDCGEFTLSVTPPPPPSAAPANDDCAGAFPLTINADVNCTVLNPGSTVGATASTGVPASSSYPASFDDDVWYKFVATQSSHEIKLTIDSGSTDLITQVLSGSCGSLVEVTAFDPETYTIAGLTSGETYYVRISTYNSGSTSTNRSKFKICINTPAPPPPPPANDECSGAITLTVNPDLSCAVITPGSTVSATQSAGETPPTCAATGINDDVWYKFTATKSSHVITITNDSGSTDRAMQVYSGSCGSLVAVQCSDPESFTVTGLTPAAEYYLRIYTYTSTSTVRSKFFICVGTLPPPPANDEASGAVALTVNANYDCGVTTSGTTTSATQSAEVAPTCSAAGINDDVWYTFTATNAAHRISFSGTSNTMAAALYSGTVGSLSFITAACASTTLNATGLTIGEKYYIRAYTTSSTVATSSNFNICIGTLPPPPTNDDAPTAISLTVNAGCPGTNFSNVLATQSANEPTGSCSSTTGYATVWFKFVAPASGAVRVSTDVGTGNTLTDSRVALFSATDVNDYGTFSIIGCDEDGGSVLGSGFMSVLYATGLVAGNTYYIQVDKYSSSSAEGSFCLTVDELNSGMLSISTNCASGQSNAGSITTYTGWVNILDANSKLIASARNAAGGSVSGYGTKSQNINAGPVRTSNLGTAYLNRNYLIANSSATNVEVQFYFLASELAALNAVDGTTLSTLGVSRQAGNICRNDFSTANGIPERLSQTGNGTTADGLVNWVTVNTPSFSNFYLHKGTEVLPITLEYFKGFKQDKSKNQLTWKIDCSNATNNSIVLERSADQQNFAAIQSITSLATDACTQPFNYVDAKANGGMNYYRLKMIDADGSFRYSNVVALYNGNQAFELVSLAPNPVKNLTNLKIASDKAIVMNISITDIAGKKVSTQKVQLVTGQNVISLDFSKLAAGTYQITGITADATLQTIRFVKQ